MIYFSPPDSNDSLTRLVLNGKEYVFHYSFNYHYGYWTMGIYEDYTTPIITCIKVVPEFPLTHYFKMVELPEGYIFVETTLERIGRKDFANENARFVFVTYEELEAYAEAMGDERILG